MLSKEAFKEFQDIYLREYGIRLSMTEATEKAADLIRLYKLALSNNEGDISNETKDSQGI